MELYRATVLLVKRDGYSLDYHGYAPTESGAVDAALLRVMFGCTMEPGDRIEVLKVTRVANIPEEEWPV